jgi:hypothetical protein
LEEELYICINEVDPRRGREWTGPNRGKYFKNVLYRLLGTFSFILKFLSTPIKTLWLQRYNINKGKSNISIILTSIID